MNSNPIQFGVVREDPEIEAHIARGLPSAAKVMLIGSGGCTAFTLLAKFPSLQLTLIEPNRSQIELIEKKWGALKTLNGEERSAAFGIGRDSPAALTECGNFESLFRSLRLFLYEFVLDYAGWVNLFSNPRDNQKFAPIFQAKFWPVAFQLFFSDAMLTAMFGQQAVQHAEPGSYPLYFQRIFERGLRANNSHKNYFLHHVFLGHYIDHPECLPAYLIDGPPNSISKLKIIDRKAQDVDDYSGFDLLSFSNIFDWMSEADTDALAKRVGNQMKPGAWLIYRQLNNSKDLRSKFGTGLGFDHKLSEQLYSSDRSLFYSRLHIARKV